MEWPMDIFQISLFTSESASVHVSNKKTVPVPPQRHRVSDQPGAFQPQCSLELRPLFRAGFLDQFKLSYVVKSIRGTTTRVKSTSLNRIFCATVCWLITGILKGRPTCTTLKEIAAAEKQHPKPASISRQRSYIRLTDE